MAENPNYPEKYDEDQNRRDFFEYRVYRSIRNKPLHPILAKILFWSIIVSGIALGTLLFLFFLTLFVYLILPVMIVLSLWVAYRYHQFKRRNF